MRLVGTINSNVSPGGRIGNRLFIMAFRTAVMSNSHCAQGSSQQYCERNGVALDQTAFYCVKNRLKPVMRTEFLVDGVEMISQSWQGNTQFLCDLR
jgi:hypothetical protein